MNTEKIVRHSGKYACIWLNAWNGTRHNCGDIVSTAMEQGVLINCTAGTVLRFLPPLNINKGQIDTVTCVLETILEGLS